MAGWALVALGFTIPLSTAGTSILLAVILLCWLAGGDYGDKIRMLYRHPLSLASLVLFGLYVVGLLYGKPSERIIFDVMHFLLLAVFITLFREERIRIVALKGFLAAVVVMMILSYLTWFSLLPAIEVLHNKPGQALVIQDKITYSFFMIMAAYFFTVDAFVALSFRIRLLSALLAVLIVGNVFMIDNKTGYLILLVLGGYFIIQRWQWRGAVAFLISILLFSSIIYHLPASALHQRMAGSVKQFNQWQPDRADLSSVGQRLEFYRYSLHIIRDHPFFGTGVGRFAEIYEKYAKDPNMELADNPHNEYLLVAAQLGLVGLAALLYLFYTQWRLAPRLPSTRDSLLAQGVVLAFAVGCLFNSFLTDYDEGVFFIWISALLFSGYPPVREAEPEPCKTESLLMS